MPLFDLVTELEMDAPAEIGYSISRGYWGRGYATEAAGAVVDSAFSAHAEGAAFSVSRKKLTFVGQGIILW